MLPSAMARLPCAVIEAVARAAVRESARLALVLTKSDALGAVGEQALARHESRVAELARQTDPEATWIRTAALGSGSDPDGLGALMGWLCGDDRVPTPVPGREEPPTRAVASFRA